MSTLYQSRPENPLFISVSTKNADSLAKSIEILQDLRTCSPLLITGIKKKVSKRATAVLIGIRFSVKVGVKVNLSEILRGLKKGWRKENYF